MNMNLKQKKEMEKAVAGYMEKLQITEAEAIELWKFDNDEISNEVVDKMEAAAKEKTAEEKKKNSPIAKVKNMKAKKKADEEKEGIIAALFGFIKASAAFVNPQEIAATKMVFKGTDGGYYTVTVTKNRTKPDGFTE